MGQAVPTFRFCDYAETGACFHITRFTYSSTESCITHTHDFCEVFWIEQGEAVHVINGETRKLGPGSTAMIRAGDVHGFKTTGDGFTMVNVAFHTCEARWVSERFFHTDSDPWSDTPLMPTTFELDSIETKALQAWSVALPGREHDRLAFEAWLLQVHHLCTIHVPSDNRGPAWLEDAIVELAQKDDLTGARETLVDLTARSPEHINRVLRATYGCTTSDMINHLRMDLAAKLLSMTSRPILHVAADCGVDNLGYFYRLFRARFGTTPRRYRLQKTALVSTVCSPSNRLTPRR